MAPQKRKEVSGASDTPSKKCKTSEDVLSGHTIRWEVEDKDQWMYYPLDLQKVITGAFREGKGEVTISLGTSGDVVINFVKMTEKAKSGWQKRIRAAVQDKKDFVTWQWQDDKSRWSAYDVTNSVVLEKTRADGGDKVNVICAKKSCTVDVVACEQIGDENGVKRKVNRKISDALAMPKIEPAVQSASSTKKKSKSQAKEEPQPSSPPKSRTLILKGKAPVDPECLEKVGKAHVYYEGNDIYDAMLNQTNLQNNNNKYYLMQLLEDDGVKRYSVWFRWGRVGKSGQNSLFPCGPNLDEAKEIFMKKFSDKTKNDWSERRKFKKVAGKYDLLKMDYSSKSFDETDSSSKPRKDVKKVPESKLDKRVQDFVQLICDVKAMEEAVLEMKYDAKKAPLGKLTTEQIKAGYSALKKIDGYISKKKFGRELTEACNEFYTRIPHDFGMQRPPVINSKEVVRAKIQLLEALGDIQVAIKMLKEGNVDDNPIDRHYKALHCSLKPLDKTHADFKMVEDYLQNTHASTHNQYKMEVVDVFGCDREGEAAAFNKLDNRKLLWHGSRLSNWAGILSRGLQIAPPEAPVTGYMFGKGVYFADMSSKSANYCFATRARNTGVLLLCEVALGNENELLSADYGADKLPSGKDSVKGLGKVAPDSAKDFTMRDGCVVPMGNSGDTGVKNPSGYTLNYNEYVVYDTRQIKMKYLCKVSFKF